MLDSLVLYYQQQQMWACAARAAVHDVIEEQEEVELMEEDEPATTSSSSLQSSPADSPEMATLSPIPVKEEEQTRTIAHEEPPRSRRRSSSASDSVLQKKKALRARMEGRSLPHRPKSPKQDIVRRVKQLREMKYLWAQPRVDMLELYRTLTETRMNSCRRLERLVRHANRSEYSAVH
ncbi:hypothetical protein HDZ31DRAFT_80243 [Schizophyllum fasciatum]